MLGLADETYYSRTAVERLDWKLFEALLARMDTSSRAFGATLYVGLHPAIEEVWEPFIADTIRRTGIPPETYDRHTLDRKVSEIAQRRGSALSRRSKSFKNEPPKGHSIFFPKTRTATECAMGLRRIFSPPASQRKLETANLADSRQAPRNSLPSRSNHFPRVEVMSKP